MTDLSLSELDMTDPYLIQTIKRRRPKSYNDFIDTLYKDIDFVIKGISDGRKYVQKKYEGASEKALKIFEDDINIQIVNGLNLLSYTAAHDKFSNGHVDIYVEMSGYPYKWFGESKIWTGVTWIDHGFKQLINDYSTGEENECCGGIIIYAVNTQLDTNSMLSSWASTLTQYTLLPNPNNIEDLKMWSNFPSNNRNSFFSSQKHPHSGLPDYTIRHVVVNFRTSK